MMVPIVWMTNHNDSSSDTMVSFPTTTSSTTSTTVTTTTATTMGLSTANATPTTNSKRQRWVDAEMVVPLDEGNDDELLPIVRVIQEEDDDDDDDDEDGMAATITTATPTMQPGFQHTPNEWDDEEEWNKKKVPGGQVVITANQPAMVAVAVVPYPIQFLLSTPHGRTTTVNVDRSQLEEMTYEEFCAILLQAARERDLGATTATTTSTTSSTMMMTSRTRGSSCNNNSTTTSTTMNRTASPTTVSVPYQSSSLWGPPFHNNYDHKDHRYCDATTNNYNTHNHRKRALVESDEEEEAAAVAAAMVLQEDGKCKASNTRQQQRLKREYDTSPPHVPMDQDITVPSESSIEERPMKRRRIHDVLLVHQGKIVNKDDFTHLWRTSNTGSSSSSSSSSSSTENGDPIYLSLKVAICGGIDRQNRVGSKFGGGGVSSAQQAERERKERLKQLALESIDLAKDPYLMRNHLGTYECKLCLTLHTNEANYLAHTQGKKHQQGLARRAHLEKLRQEKDASSIATPTTAAAATGPATARKVRIGRPAYQVFKSRDATTNQRCLSFELSFPELDDATIQPRHRFMSAFEQKIESPPDRRYQYLLFAAEPYETVAFKIPNDPIDKEEGRFVTHWDVDEKKFTLTLYFMDPNQQQQQPPPKTTNHPTAKKQ